MDHLRPIKSGAQLRMHGDGNRPGVAFGEGPSARTYVFRARLAFQVLAHRFKFRDDGVGIGWRNRGAIAPDFQPYASIVQLHDHLVIVDAVPELLQLALRVEPRRRGPVTGEVEPLDFSLALRDRQRLLRP